MVKEKTPEKLIKICKRCNNTYAIGYDDIVFYKSINSELFNYCPNCRLMPENRVIEEKDWCHNPLK